MIVLDTNVVSALMRPDAEPAVVSWVNDQVATRLRTSSVTVMEIEMGLLQMPSGRRRDGLTRGFATLLENLLAGRVLALDIEAARQAAIVATLQTKRGNNTAIGDFQIAGICRARGATLATRNVRDFSGLDIPLIDPWVKA